MKMRRNLVVALVAGAGFATPALAQFGGLGGMLGGGRPAGGGDVGAQVADFLARTAVLSVTAAGALQSINAAFASEEDLARKRKEQAELNAITDPKEKQARAAQIYQSESAEAEQRAKSGDLQQMVNNLDDAKKKRIGQALFNFGIGLLQAPGLIKSAQGILQGVASNPMMITRAIPVKDAVPVLQKIVSDGGSTIATFIKVARGANISVPTATESSKPVEDPL